MRRWLLVPLLLVAACDPGADPIGSDDPRPRPVPITTDGGASCVRPSEGCPCDEGSVPLDCYWEPEEADDGALVCHEGTQYCRDGVWSACESVREFRIESSATALITGPDACNPCDPRCFVSRDVPTPGDLTSGNSTNVSYDATAGGVTLTPGVPSSPPLTDGDGDGVPDVADECAGAGWFRNPDGSCHTGPALYHSLPYGTSAIDPLTISTRIRTADVYFLMDTTGSMGGELARLKTDLTSGSFGGCSGGIIGAIRCTIPDAWFGVGYHDDYPIDPFGGSGDLVYRNLLDIQSSVGAAQAAVNSLSLHWGNDGPESQTQALWAIATGGGLSSHLAARTGCAGGTWGYPCFRAGTIPIVVLITDAPFHNGPGGAYPYASLPALPPPTAVSGNERMNATAYGPVDITSAWVGFSGNTGSMGDNHTTGCGGGSSGDAVFRVTLTSTQTVQFTLSGSSYDTVLGVFPVGGGSGWCNDDSVGTASALTLTLGAGDYWVLVDGYGGSEGAYRLTMGRPPATTFSGASWADTTNALASRGVRTITVQTCGYWSDAYCLEGERHARDLGNASGAIGSSGSPYVFRANDDGTGLSATIVSAIQDLANYSRMDVSARVVGDTQGFTRLPITAVSWTPGGACAGISGGTTFTQCLPGTNVNFSVTFRNDAVMPTTSPQVFTFFIEIIGDGTAVLTRVPVRIVVPAVAASFPSSGTYWRDYDSTLRCAINESPDWGQLSWATTTPAGTRVVFELRAATTAAGLATATRVGTVTSPATAPPIDLVTALRAAGYPDGMPHLRVTAVLYANSTRTASPTLTSMDVTYRCVPSM